MRLVYNQIKYLLHTFRPQAPPQYSRFYLFRLKLWGGPFYLFRLYTIYVLW